MNSTNFINNCAPKSINHRFNFIDFLNSLWGWLFINCKFLLWMNTKLEHLNYDFIILTWNITTRVSGLFEFRRPVVFVRDPKIVKHLAVKEFDHFMDHRVVITEDIDPMFGKSLVSLTGQKWKGVDVIFIDLQLKILPHQTCAQHSAQHSPAARCGLCTTSWVTLGNKQLKACETNLKPAAKILSSSKHLQWSSRSMSSLHALSELKSIHSKLPTTIFTELLRKSPTFHQQAQQSSLLDI